MLSFVGSKILQFDESILQFRNAVTGWVVDNIIGRVVVGFESVVAGAEVIYLSDDQDNNFNSASSTVVKINYSVKEKK